MSIYPRGLVGIEDGDLAALVMQISGGANLTSYNGFGYISSINETDAQVILPFKTVYRGMWANVRANDLDAGAFTVQLSTDEPVVGPTLSYAYTETGFKDVG